MRHSIILTLCTATIMLSACAKSGEEQVQEAMSDINVIDESNLNEVMLTVGDPEEAVRYFANAVENHPERVDLQRGLAASLIRAGRVPDGIAAWETVISHPEATSEDTVELAGALIRASRWDDAAAQLNTVPPTYETFKRYRFEAMVADSRQQWEKADSFYETAAGLTTRPASVYNNWGYSKLTRGDYRGAERLFTDALRHDPRLFTAKNNLVLARGAQRKYTLPVVQMTQVERAQLLYTLALAAIKQNDISTGKTLLADAIETHPRHFEEAVRALQAIENNAVN
ncbi:Flp pilus assembly protein TadD [Yoonia maritima]|uniref:Flp pilus assembly protein TadD n=1 Tax=Yoonia maritima TaxID=1435347 RepID=A0A2T0VXX8_9RHOB|nr:tetratricopeptide repeat protein [Yoonia maritima]PRY76958.1 Flp pilus assembly protein TadD [Yoonia maritima]